MKQLYLLTSIVLFLLPAYESGAQCPSGEVEVAINIVPDQFPSEISWALFDSDSNVIANGGSVGQTLCVSDNLCLIFEINDSYGDGIFAPGGYSLTYNGSTVIQRVGFNYGSGEYWHMGCPAGYSCQAPLTVSQGSYTAPQSETWYAFTPDSTGVYLISTCNNNSCDTKLWVYDVCEGINITPDVEGTSYFDDNYCGLQSNITAVLDASVIYYIRVGDNAGNCGLNPIDWSITYDGPVAGCTDPSACNYEPLATVSDSCIYPGNPLCPDGPDLIISQEAVENSIFLASYNNTDPCSVVEGCVTGMGQRTVLRFTTHIKNIGNQDYFIGSPSVAPHLFDLNNCHGHPHYIGYADYILFDKNGQEIPVGFKSGFCVLDVECSGGGTPKYGCSNMGISAGCGDIYGTGTTCNWIDITDVDTGKYTFVLRTNWDQKPDAAGRHELDYSNNWAQVCIRLSYDANGDLAFSLDTDCPIFVDCAGDTLGSSQFDCQGVCNGPVLTGDLDQDTVVDASDVNGYIIGALNNSIASTACTDLNDDGNITVSDAALVNRCTQPDGAPDRCVFPNGFFNSLETVEFSIASVDWSNQFFDIAIRNPNTFLLGYQLEISGVTISGVDNLINPAVYPVTALYNATNSYVFGLSLEDSTISKNVSPISLCRVYYSAMTGSSICISNVTGVINQKYEDVVGTVTGSCATNNGVPFNDLCGNATPIGCGMSTSGATTGATITDEPATCGTSITAPGVWYRFVGNGDQMTVTTCNSGTNFDTKLNVYKGSCGNLVCVAGNDDDNGCGQSTFSTIVQTTEIGVDYFIYVNGYNGATGDFELSISCIDLCPDPTALTTTNIGENSVSLTWASSNAGAIYAIEIVPTNAAPGSGNNVVPPTTGTYGITGPPVTINGLSPSTSFDVYLTEDCGNGNVSSLIGPVSFTTSLGVPFNDLCSNATILNCGQTVSGATLGATDTDLPSTCNTSATAAGVWYKILGNGGNMTASTCGAATDYDTKLHVYEGTCGTLNCVTGNDDVCGLSSSVTWPSVNGVDYFLYVSGYNSQVGNYGLTLTCDSMPVSNGNDICNMAQPITCGQSLSGTTIGMTLDNPNGTGACGTSITAPGAWYEWTGTGAYVTFSLCDSTDYDSKISVFSGSSCTNLVCVAGNDDYPGCSGTSSELSFNSINGTAYYILVHGFGAATGNFVLSVSCAAPCLPVPSNDDCSNPITLNVNAPGNCQSVTGNNQCASTALFNPSCDANGSIQDVWYQFNSGNYNSVDLNLLLGSKTDINYALYSGCGGTELACGSNGSGTYTLPALALQTNYLIQVWNQGGSNSGTFDICLTGTTVAVNCDPPDNTQTTDVDAHTATLNWDPVANADAYQVRGKATGSQSWVYLNMGSAATTHFDVIGLPNNTSFEWQIRSFCNTGTDTSDWSLPEIFTTVCEAPSLRFTDNITATSATLNWSINTSAIGYKITGKPLGSQTLVTLLVSGGNKSFFHVSGLVPGYSYTWNVAPVCDYPIPAVLNYTANDTFTTLNSNKTSAAPDAHFIGNVKVYPNPARDQIHIEFKYAYGLSRGSIELIDVNGKKLQARQELISDQTHYQMDVSHISSGVYFMVVQTEHHRIVEKLMISK